MTKKTLTHQEVLDLHAAIDAARNVGGADQLFSYALAMTRRAIQPAIEHITAETARAAEKQRSLALECAAVDDHGAPILDAQGNFIFRPDRRKRFTDRLAAHEKAFKAFLKRKVGVQLYPVTWDLAPAELTPGMVDGLLPLLPGPPPGRKR